MTPDFSMMPCLVKLTFEECTKLVEVHESVGQLKSLVWLSLKGCAKLEKLPDTIFQLTSLKPSGSSKLTCCSAYVHDVLPDPCCQRKTQLELIDDTIEELTETFTRWENLEALILNCRSLKSLLVGVGKLPKLKVLEVFENLKILCVNGDPMDVTPSFPYLPCLEKLMLTNCKELIEVHESIGSLKKLQFLKISGCTMLARLSDNICELRSLTSLDLKGCVNLSSLPEQLVDHMELLEELCLDRTGIGSLPAALIAKLPTSLWSLSIKNSQPLKSIPESPISSLFKGMSNNDFFELKSTTSLRASTSWEFMDALPISCCESVLKLYFTNERIEKLTDSIGLFEHVESLTLRCKMLKALPDSIGQSKNLEDLIVKCHTLALFD
ncbi:popC protein [Nymphaea thermarum]|nr:popC protein [Nymphaea thermarum]